jgi:hypothetical protein
MYTVDTGTYLGVVAVSLIFHGSRPAHAIIMRGQDLTLLSHQHPELLWGIQTLLRCV